MLPGKGLTRYGHSSYQLLFRGSSCFSASSVLYGACQQSFNLASSRTGYPHASQAGISERRCSKQPLHKNSSAF